MKNIDHLSPIYECVFKNHWIMGGRSHLRKYFVIQQLEQQLPELKFDIRLDFPFNPNHIPKVKNRKYRRACYQSFGLYKKSFKPRPKLVWANLLNKSSSDMADAMSYAFLSLSQIDFKKNYMCTWDLAKENEI